MTVRCALFLRRLFWPLMVLSGAALIVVLWQLHHLSAQDYRPPGVGPDVDKWQADRPCWQEM